MCSRMDARGWSTEEIAMIRQMAIMGVHRDSAVEIILMALNQERKGQFSFINSLQVSLSILASATTYEDRTQRGAFRAFY